MPILLPTASSDSDQISPAPAQPRGRRTSRVLFIYLAKEFLVPLGCCLGGLIALFLIVDLLDVLRDFLDAQASPLTVLLFFALRQPANLVHILPMAILLSASYTINALNRHHEILALRASGLSLIRCCLPMWLTALAAALICFLLNEGIALKCAALADKVLEQTTAPGRKHGRAWGKLAFQNARGDRDWFFERFSRDGEKSGVVIKQFGPNRHILWELRAKHATYEDGTWVFRQGTISHFDAEGRLPEGAPERFTRRSFPELDESPLRIMRTLRPVEELTAREIFMIMRTHPNLPQSARAMYATTIWYRISFPLSCLIAAFLGVALSLTQERSNLLRGFAVAVGAMIAYYLVTHGLVLLGRNGFVPPFYAGGLPTLAFVGWSGWEIYQKR